MSAAGLAVFVAAAGRRVRPGRTSAVAVEARAGTAAATKHTGRDICPRSRPAVVVPPELPALKALLTQVPAWMRVLYVAHSSATR